MKTTWEMSRLVSPPGDICFRRISRTWFAGWRGFHRGGSVFVGFSRKTACECVCVCVRERSSYLKSSLEDVRSTWQQWQWKSPALGHGSVCVCVCQCVSVCVCALRKRSIWMYWSWDGISVWEVFCSYTRNEIIKEQTMLDHRNTACSHLTSVSQFIYVLLGIARC